MTKKEFFDIMAESMVLNYQMDETFRRHNLPFVYDSLETMLPLLPKEDREKVKKINGRYLALMTRLCAENCK